MFHYLARINSIEGKSAFPYASKCAYELDNTETASHNRLQLYVNSYLPTTNRNFAITPRHFF